MFAVTKTQSDPTVVELVNSEGKPVSPVCDYLRYVSARGCSPNTILAYAYDCAHLWAFLAMARLQWDELNVARAADLLVYLGSLQKQRHQPTKGLSLATESGLPVKPRLAPSTINRVLAGVSAFYDWAILTERYVGANPMAKAEDCASPRVLDRHRPFLSGVSRRRVTSRLFRAKTIRRLPRPMNDAQIDALMVALRNIRDLALVHLMLNGGLRPGEVLGLHLSDISYGRRRVAVRCRNDHPKGARSKSRTERLVDLHDGTTLATVNAYVMTARPADADTPIVFLVGGNGTHRCEPLSYSALVRLFARATERADIREPWLTPHALRHTHATRMWEAGMRELTLQRRLGHASPESTKIYTRVSDAVVVEEYRRALGLADDPTPDEK